MMLLKSICFFACVGVCLSATTEVSVMGKVTDGNDGLGGAKLSLSNYPDISAVSDTGGNFSLMGSIETGISVPYDIASVQGTQFGIQGDLLQFSLHSKSAEVSVQVFSAAGRLAYTHNVGPLGTGMHTATLPSLSAGLYVVHLITDGLITAGKLVSTGNGSHCAMGQTTGKSGSQFRIGAVVQTTVVDSLMVEKTGYERKSVPVGEYSISNLEVALKKEGPVECADFEVLPVQALEENEKLPDPFAYIDGSRIAEKKDWPCLRKQLIGLLGFSHGNLPEDIGDVSAVYDGGKLKVTIKVNGKGKSFDVSIKNVPSGEGPFPAIITLGGSTVSIPAGIAEISLPQRTIAEEKSRSGVYADLYGNKEAGSMLMWAWGVGRIIDGLEMTTGHKIDPTRLGVTGCSRNGKGAMVCGAYEERIALTLPMEGGSGGISSWRIADVENRLKREHNHPDGCQTASQIVGESGWLAPQFDQFAIGNAGIDKLPVDAHTLAAICAPRALLFVEGSLNSWNCNVCCWTAASAAQMVYEALGVKDNIGMVMTDHNHCSGYGSKEKDAFNAFCKRFLLGDESVSTGEYFTKDGKFDDLIDFSEWIDWEAPELN